MSNYSTSRGVRTCRIIAQGDVYCGRAACPTCVHSPCSHVTGVWCSEVRNRIKFHIYGNIFSQIIVSRYTDKLCTSDILFGFKRQRSTNVSTMVLKEAILYYVNNGSSVFCTLLDTTKAFDRVKYVKLLKLLIVRDIPPVSLRLLLNTCHGIRIAWNGVCSYSFSVLNGVKQGGVFSQILFCIIFMAFYAS